ncbi:isoprenylcysteine carboxylmethyltransferase family protein [Herbiconiux sp. L3-i23]|uniref:methyltransferase family protein n=1 Tax=Herbiconiux sp. L3-i23 TaxID=2905871 RepID=UPI002053CE9D|nr:isoprenylcysteine carboxylmethyltransferase family protein [Herbiconiux sp. L3-i23]BDI21370.1 protein-S-isoprenylcysteine O-methyltransferase [Herbiconiux sp. L3-i23]
MRWGRVYFALQAFAGAAWWVSVFTVPVVRTATLGSLDPMLVAIADIPLFVIGSALAALEVRAAAEVATAWTSLVLLALAVYATATGEAGWGVLAMAAAVGGSVLALLLVRLGRIPTEWIIAGPFAFRPARSRIGWVSHLGATLAQIIVFWGFFLVVMPTIIAFVERRWGFFIQTPPIVAVGGLVVFAAASALGLWAAVAMSTHGDGTPLPAAMTNRLVIAGPYRFVRNPMAMAGIVQGAAVGLMLSSWLVVVYAIAGSLVWNYIVRPLEEADLESRFGEAYDRYRTAVRCWVPRIPGVAPLGR